MNKPFAICVILVLFLSLNAVLTLATAVLWKFIDKHSLRWSAKKRARLAFTLSILPTGLSAIFIFFFFIPAFVVHEKHNPHEFIGTKLLLLSLLAFSCLAWAVCHSFFSLLRTRIQISKWAHEENLLDLKSTSLPAYRIKHDYPIIAVAGFFRPKIFIDEKVFEILNEDELAAVIAHEQAHVESNDNWKRLALNFCKSLLIYPFNGRIETAWENSMEAVADRRASNETLTRPLDLASALTKLARVMKENPQARLVASHISSDWQAPVASRVHRLVKLSNEFSVKEEQSVVGRSGLLVIALGLSVTFLLSVTQTDLLGVVHRLIEVFVKVLV